MKKILLYIAVGLVVGSAAFSGCSNKKDAEPKKGAIEKMTDDRAKEIEEMIRNPLEKAQSVQKTLDDRFRDIDENY